MKRIAMLLLCLLLSVMLLASCGGGSKKSAEDLIADAFAATKALDDYELKTALTVATTYGAGAKETLSVTVDTKATDVHSGSPKIYMDVKAPYHSNSVLYFEGDWIYFAEQYEDETVSYKIPASTAEEADLYSYASNLTLLLPELPTELFSGVKASSNDDGSETVSLSLTAEQAKTLFSSLASSTVEDMFGGFDEDVTVTYAPSTLTASVKDGLVSSYSLGLSLSVSMDYDGNPATKDDVESASIAMTYDIKLLKTSDVTITPPEGYRTFEVIGEADDVIAGAFDAVKSLDALEYETLLTMIYTMNGQSKTISIKVLAKIVGAQSDSPKILLNVSLTDEDGDTEIGSLYLDGEWLYVTEGDGEGYKVPAKYASAFGLDVYMADFGALFVTLPPEAFNKNMTEIWNDDGSDTFGFHLSPKLTEELFADLAVSLTEHDGPMTFTSSFLETTVKAGLVSNYKLEFNVIGTVDADGDPGTTEDMTSIIYYLAYNLDITKTSDVTVTPPEGYLDFEDASQLLD